MVIAVRWMIYKRMNNMLGKVKDIMKVYKYVGQYTTNMLGKDDVMNIPFHCHPPRRGLGGVGCNNLTPRIRGCFD